jgi:outer membrane lipoprotein-sorting protein
MRKLLLAVACVATLAAHASAQTADEIVEKFIKTVGGMEKIQAVKSLRRVGKYDGGGGFEAVLIEENRRPNLVRQEFVIQGMTGVTAYDGRTGWKIEPWNGKKDAEALSEEEMKGIIEDSDLDGPLVNYKQKGVKVEYVGTDEVEGTDTYKLKVTLANGDVRFYYMDTDYYVPIKIDTKRIIRGAEREYETVLGDYKEVGGWYLPFSVESGVKGNPNRSKVTYEKIEANVALEDTRFAKPAAKSAPAAVPDASNTAPKETTKAEPGKPPTN